MHVFLHGYSTNITSPVQKPLGIEKGLYGVASKDFAAFDWSLPFHLSLLQLIDPKTLASMYHAERKLTQDRAIHDRLRIFLERQQPRVIIAHSMGCELLVQHVRIHSLPESVKRIVWMQADVDSDIEIPDEILKRELYHLFCPWDPVLAIGSVYHRKRRAGLMDLRDRRVKNILLPATRLPNLHTSCLHDTRIKSLLE